MTFTTNRIFKSLFCAAVLSALLGVLFRPPLYPPYQEGVEYAALAHSNDARMHSYYAGRVLHPWSVRFISNLLKTDPDARIFRALSEASLICVFVLLALYYAKEGCSWTLILFAISPILITQYRNYYWADLFYMAVWLGFLLTLRYNVWLSLPLLVALYLTRESTIVLVVALIIVALLQGRKLFAVGAFCAGALGASFISQRVSEALPNTHSLAVWQLDLLKLPFNFALNILGLNLWTNTIASTTAPPVRVMTLPSAFQMGAIARIGFIDWSWTRPAGLVVVFACAFGALPFIAFRHLRLRNIKEEPFDYAVSVVFGTLMLALTPLSGTTPDRYILYAAPLFWIAVARLMRHWRLQRILGLAAVSIFLCWFPAIVRVIGQRELTRSTRLLPTGPGQLIVSLVSVVIGWVILSSTALVEIRSHANSAAMTVGDAAR